MAGEEMNQPVPTHGGGEHQDEDSTPLYQDTNTPLIFADGYHGVTLAHGVIRLNLTQARLIVNNSTHDQELVRYVVGHLAIPKEAVKGFRDALDRLLTSLREDGHLAPDDADETESSEGSTS